MTFPGECKVINLVCFVVVVVDIDVDLSLQRNVTVLLIDIVDIINFLMNTLNVGFDADACG